MEKVKIVTYLRQYFYLRLTASQHVITIFSCNDVKLDISFNVSLTSFICERCDSKPEIKVFTISRPDTKANFPHVLFYEANKTVINMFLNFIY